MGPAGVGFLYIADPYLGATPPAVGWLAAANVSDWDVRLCRLYDDAMRFQGGIPNLVGSVGWTSPTSLGGTFGPIPYVSGFQGGFTASKRLNPLVVFMRLSYFSALSHLVAGTRVDPSDVIGARMGASLASSPTTRHPRWQNGPRFAPPHPW